MTIPGCRSSLPTLKVFRAQLLSKITGEILSDGNYIPWELGIPVRHNKILLFLLTQVVAEKNLGDHIFQLYGANTDGLKKVGVLGKDNLFCLLVSKFLIVGSLGDEVIEHLVIHSYRGEVKPETFLVPQDTRQELWLPLYSFDISCHGKHGCPMTSTSCVVLFPCRHLFRTKCT